MANHIKPLSALVSGEALRIQSLWISHLSLTAVVLIMVAAIDHSALLFGTNQTVPVLNVPIDVVGFSVATPVFYLCIHAYLLIKICLLKSAYRNFERVLRTTVVSASEREEMRRTLVMSPILHSMINSDSMPKLIHVTIVGLNILTVALLPLAILTFIAIAFLPYQSDVLTTLHIVVLIADLAVLLLAGVIIVDGAFAFSTNSGLAAAVFLLLSATALFSLITFPGSRFDDSALGRLFWGRETIGEVNSTSLHGAFPTTLDFSNAVIGSADQTLRLAIQDRSFVGANFSGAKITRVQFSGSDLTAANFSQAELNDVDLSCNAASAGARGIPFDNWLALFDRRLAGAKLDIDVILQQQKRLGCNTLANVKFERVSISGSNFGSVILHDFDLAGEEIENTVFDNALFYDIGMGHQSFRDSSFKGTRFAFTVEKPATVFFRGGVMDSASVIHTSNRALSFNTDMKRAELDVRMIEGSLRFHGDGSGSLDFSLRDSIANSITISDFKDGTIEIAHSDIHSIWGENGLPSMEILCSTISDEMRLRGILNGRSASVPLHGTIFGTTFGNIRIEDYTAYELDINFSQGKGVGLFGIRRNKTPRSNGTDQIEIIASEIGRLSLFDVATDVLELQHSAIKRAEFRDLDVSGLYVWGLAVAATGRVDDLAGVEGVQWGPWAFKNDDDGDDGVADRVQAFFDYFQDRCSDDRRAVAIAQRDRALAMEHDSDWQAPLSVVFPALVARPEREID